MFVFHKSKKINQKKKTQDFFSKETKKLQRTKKYKTEKTTDPIPSSAR
jgi:hypothetical protein